MDGGPCINAPAAVTVVARLSESEVAPGGVTPGRGRAACPFCGRTGPIDPGDGLGCCIPGSQNGYWSDDDGLWYYDDDKDPSGADALGGGGPVAARHPVELPPTQDAPTLARAGLGAKELAPLGRAFAGAAGAGVRASGGDATGGRAAEVAAAVVEWRRGLDDVAAFDRLAARLGPGFISAAGLRDLAAIGVSVLALAVSWAESGRRDAAAPADHPQESDPKKSHAGDSTPDFNHCLFCHGALDARRGLVLHRGRKWAAHVKCAEDAGWRLA